MTPGRVELIDTADGWVFKAGKMKIGPFSDPGVVSALDVAAQFSKKTNQLEELKDLLKRSADAKREGGQALELELQSEYSSRIRNWPIQPKHVFEAKLRAGEKGPLHVHINLGKLEAELVTKPVQLNTIIAGRSQRKAIPKTITAFCPICSTEKDLTLQEIAQTHGAEYVLDLIRGDWRFFAKKYIDLLNINSPSCEKGKPHKWVIEKKNYEDYSVLHIRDAVRSQQDLETKQFQTIPIFLLGQVLNGCSKAMVEGTVAVDPKNHNLTILADRVQRLESEIISYQLTADDKRLFERYFIENSNLEADLEKSVAPDVIERFEPKLALTLALHTPVFIQLGGKTIRGCPRVIFYGDTKTCKSTLLLFVSKQLELGEYGVGETSSRTGILYTIDPDSRTLIWGIIPQNDLGVAMIDGLNKLDPDELSRFRETLEKMTLKVHRMVSGERLCRTRILAAFNPKNDLAAYVHKCYALTLEESQCFAAPPDYTRWDMWIPFDKNDVPAKRFGEGYTRIPTIPLAVLKKSMMWGMSRKQNQVIIPNDIFREIETVAGQFIEEYACSELPLVHNGYIEVVARISVGFAGLYHSTDKTHERIIVEKSHVEKARQFLEWMIEANEYNQFVEWSTGKKELTSAERKELLEILGDPISRGMLQTLARGRVQCSTLAGTYNVTERTIKNKARNLKGLGLIESGYKGYKLLPKGVKVVKEHLLDNGKVKEDFPVSPSEDRGGVKNSQEEKEGGLSQLGEKVKKPFPKSTSKSIDDMFKGPSESLTEQETLVLLKSKWTSGYQQDFIKLITEVRQCSQEDAEDLFKKWRDKDGLLAYDPDGWVVWI